MRRAFQMHIHTTALETSYKAPSRIMSEAYISKVMLLLRLGTSIRSISIGVHPLLTADHAIYNHLPDRS